MSDFILEYDMLESIAAYSKSLGKRAGEYEESLENKIISGIASITGPSTGYLQSASDSVRDKVNALKQKSDAFYHYAEQITNLLETAERIDQEVADAITAQREYFLDHHKSLRLDDWKAKLLGLLVDLKNSIPLLGTIADLLEGLNTVIESLGDSIRHWYECEGGKYVIGEIAAVAEACLAVAIFAATFPISTFTGFCLAVGLGIAALNSCVNVKTSYKAAEAAMDGNPALAEIYGKQDTLSDVLRQKNYGNGTMNNLSNFTAGALDVTETVCIIVGMAGQIVNLFKKSYNLIKYKKSLNYSGLQNNIESGSVKLENVLKEEYKNIKNIGLADDTGAVGELEESAGLIKGSDQSVKVSKDIAFNKNIADPMRDFAGSGIDSNPSEWNAIIKQLQNDGVEIIYRDKAMAYSPGLLPGNPGQLIIDPEASYSALFHEYQHYLDDAAGGFQGMRQLYDQNGRIIKELRAYMQEIKMADKMGLKDIANQLWENYRQERFNILNK